MADTTIPRLRSFLSPERAARIEQVLERRLAGITVLLEGTYDHGNMAAVLRTCEAFGVQTVHLVDVPETFKPAKKVGQGAQKWLTLRLHESPRGAVTFLKDRGFRLLAGALQATRSLDEVDFARPTALVFGAEKDGLSSDLLRLCDETYQIPMVGFTQSLNLSCAASIALFRATHAYRRALGLRGDLGECEKTEVRKLFYRRAVRYSDLLLSTGSDSNGE